LISNKSISDNIVAKIAKLIDSIHSSFVLTFFIEVDVVEVDHHLLILLRHGKQIPIMITIISVYIKFLLFALLTEFIHILKYLSS
jgi:hypothetical protein